MRHTRALFAAAISLYAIFLAGKSCLAQDAQSYATGRSDSGTVAAPQAAGALSPGHSLAWSKMHLPVGVADTEAQRALALAERTIQSNQRRYCGVLYLAEVAQNVSGAPPNLNNNNVSFNPCP